MRGLRLLVIVGVGALVAYGIYAATTWVRYGTGVNGTSTSGRGRGGGSSSPDLAGDALDRYLPTYEVSESHETRVAAPAAVTLAAARELDFEKSPLARIIFKSRRLLMGGSEPGGAPPRTTMEQIRSLGWSLLEEVPGRTMVFGAVTQPWEANVRFQGLPPAEFARFQEPGYAKIIWTLEADPVDSTHSIFRTRTRVATTDPRARERFRVYWAQFSPGILLIRKQALGLVKAEAERRAAVKGPS